MDKNLQDVTDFIQQNPNMSDEQKDSVLKSIKAIDKELQILSFKLDRTEKVKRTTAILLEETIEELEQKRKAVEEALTELKATQNQLIQQEKLASLGQLTAGIAHEIKNPLNFVNNFSEVSLELVEEARVELSAKDGKQLEEALKILNDIEANLKKIHEHGSRADSIVKSMLEHSRSGSGKRESTDLNALVKEYVNLSFHGMRAGKNPIDVNMEFDLDDSIGEVPLIAEDFSRVIVNLCNNAFDACAERSRSAMRQKMTEGGRPKTGKNSPLEGSGEAERSRGVSSMEDYKPKLTVRTKSDGNSITLEIEDNGPGIPDDIKDKILQPFFTTKKGTQGTGLGLSITNDIIKAHGGQLDIKTEKRNGSLFIVTFPAV